MRCVGGRDVFLYLGPWAWALRIGGIDKGLTEWEGSEENRAKLSQDQACREAHKEGCGISSERAKSVSQMYLTL